MVVNMPQGLNATQRQRFIMMRQAQQRAAQVAASHQQQQQQQMQMSPGQQAIQQQMQQQQMQQQQMQQSAGSQAIQQHEMAGAAPGSSATDNHALQDYQMQLMVLEQQNKKRVLMKRQEDSKSSASADTIAPDPQAAVENKSLSAFGNSSLPTSTAPAETLGLAFSNDDMMDFDTSYGSSAVDALQNFDFDSFLHVEGNEVSLGGDSAFEVEADSSTRTGASPSSPRQPGYDPMSPGYSPISPSFSPTSPTYSPTTPTKVKPSVTSSAAAVGFTGFGAASATALSSTERQSAFGAPSTTSPFTNASVFGAAPTAPTTGTQQSGPVESARSNTFKPTVFNTQSPPSTPGETLDFLISKQGFAGYWLWDSLVFAALRISMESAETIRSEGGWGKAQWATAVVIAFLEERLEGEKGSWELVVEKAREWLAEQVGGEKILAEMLGKARGIV